MNECIKVEALTVHYDRVAALIDINVEIKKGALTAIVGPNGAGKSTFVKAILNLTPRTSGSISFFGKPFEQIKDKIAYVCQTKEIDWDFPILVEEVVLMGAFLKRRKGDKEKCEQLLHKFGLAEKRKSLIAELSGGQKQRLFLARAYMADPEIYVFDEPMAFVDFTTSEMIMQSLKELQSLGKTVICVHHNLAEVKEFFDQVVLLSHYLVAAGNVEQCLTDSTIKLAYNLRDSLLTEAFVLSKEKESGSL
jgi:manganese/zinc/iron transport system ATP- binding protein